MEPNIFNLYRELKNKTYHHSNYTSFYIKDPKLRKIHKAKVKDRVLHHAIFRVLYPIFDTSFIFDSYSCRNDKGTHRAVKRLNAFARKISQNNTKNCFFLKCDIKKFFDSIDQDILLGLLRKRIKDNNVIWLLEGIIKSFQKGLPLGNVISQLFSNIYLHELDTFVKRTLKVKYYIRYCDDFIITEDTMEKFENYIKKVDGFLKNHLKLMLHPNKIIIRKYHQGVDFLGYVSFPNHIMLRNGTKKRMFKKIDASVLQLEENKISKKSFHQVFQSYLGILSHCDSCGLKEKMVNTYARFLL